MRKDRLGGVAVAGVDGITCSTVKSQVAQTWLEAATPSAPNAISFSSLHRGQVHIVVAILTPKLLVGHALSDGDSYSRRK
jgi:hypothetical protein